MHNAALGNLTHIIWSLYLFVMLIIPKMNVFFFPGTYVGLKIEDIFVIALFLPVSAANLVLGKNTNRVYTRDLFGILLLSVLFIVLQVVTLFFNSGNLVFVARYCLYILPMAILLMTEMPRDRIVRTDAFIVNLVQFAVVFYFAVVLLQYAGIIGGFYLGNYAPDVRYRPMAVFSHPTELGVVTSFLFSLVLFRPEVPVWRKIALFLAMLTINYISKNRMGLLIVIMVFAFYMIRDLELMYGRSRLHIVKYAGIVLTGLVMLVVLAKNERFQDFSFPGMSFWMDYAEQVTGSDGKPLRLGGNIDPSLRMRLEKWFYYVRDFNSEPGSWLVGRGGGYFGEAMDGLYLRVLLENGFFLLGLMLCLIVMIIAWLRRSDGTRGYVFSILVVLFISIFLDSLYFSRMGYLFWFVTGIGLLMARRDNAVPGASQ